MIRAKINPQLECITIWEGNLFVQIFYDRLCKSPVSEKIACWNGSIIGAYIPIKWLTNN